MRGFARIIFSYVSGLDELRPIRNHVLHHSLSVPVSRLAELCTGIWEPRRYGSDDEKPYDNL